MYKKYIKRLLDIIISVVSLTLLAPVFSIIALCIKAESKGPAFFKQKRLGKDGQIFEIIKFRSMVVGAETMGTGLKVKGPEDSRITKVGCFLRKTSLDEIPQFINVLNGSMSVIGPRPPAVYFPYDGYENYPDWAKKRFDVRPGLTGLAQVIYRNNAPWDKRIELDNQYIDNNTLTADVRILLRTIKCVFSSANVYREKKDH